MAADVLAYQQLTAELNYVLKNIKCACREAEIQATRSISFPSVLKQRLFCPKTLSSLEATIVLLQDKCKEKDRIISAIFKELKSNSDGKEFDDLLKRISESSSAEINFNRIEISDSLQQPWCDSRFGRSNGNKKPNFRRRCQQLTSACQCGFASTDSNNCPPLILKRPPSCVHPDYPFCPCPNYGMANQQVERCRSGAANTLLNSYQYANCHAFVCLDKNMFPNKCTRNQCSSDGLTGCSHPEYPFCQCNRNSESNESKTAINPKSSLKGSFSSNQLKADEDKLIPRKVSYDLKLEVNEDAGASRKVPLGCKSCCLPNDPYASSCMHPDFPKCPCAILDGVDLSSTKAVDKKGSKCVYPQSTELNLDDPMTRVAPPGCKSCCVPNNPFAGTCMHPLFPNCPCATSKSNEQSVEQSPEALNLSENDSSVKSENPDYNVTINNGCTNPQFPNCPCMKAQGSFYEECKEFVESQNSACKNSTCPVLTGEEKQTKSDARLSSASTGTCKTEIVSKTPCGHPDYPFCPCDISQCKRVLIPLICRRYDNDVTNCKKPICCECESKQNFACKHPDYPYCPCSAHCLDKNCSKDQILKSLAEVTHTENSCIADKKPSSVVETFPTKESKRCFNNECLEDEMSCFLPTPSELEIAVTKGYLVSKTSTKLSDISKQQELSKNSCQVTKSVCPTKECKKCLIKESSDDEISCFLPTPSELEIAVTKGYLVPKTSTKLSDVSKQQEISKNSKNSCQVTNSVCPTNESNRCFMKESSDDEIPCFLPTPSELEIAVTKGYLVPKINVKLSDISKEQELSEKSKNSCHVTNSVCSEKVSSPELNPIPSSDIPEKCITCHKLKRTQIPRPCMINYQPRTCRSPSNGLRREVSPAQKKSYAAYQKISVKDAKQKNSRLKVNATHEKVNSVSPQSGDNDENAKFTSTVENAEPQKQLGLAKTESTVSITEVRRVTVDSLIIKWSKSTKNGINGYEVEVDGVVKARIFSKIRTTAVLHSLPIDDALHISVYATNSEGRCGPPGEAIFQV